MITHETENYIILCPRFKIFSQKAVDEILNLIQTPNSKKEYAIDMSAIYSISSEFLNMLNTLDKKVALLNCCAEVLVLLNLTNCDKKVKLFTSLIDLEEDKRELLNRKFALL